MPQLTATASKFTGSFNIAKQNNTKILLSTTNTFVDKDIELTINVNSGQVSAGIASATATLNNTDTSNAGINVYPVMSAGQSTEPTSGYFIAVNASATAQNSVTQAGWLPTGNLTAMNASSTTYFPIGEGDVTVSGGGLSAGSGHVSLSAASGYYNGTSYDTTDIVDITSQTSEASGFYKLVAQGYGDVNRGDIYKQNTTAGYIPLETSGTIVSSATSFSSSSQTINYYIAKSTLSSSSITPSTSQQTVTIGAGYYPSSRTITINAMNTVIPTTGMTQSGLSNFATATTLSDTTKDITLTPNYTSNAGYISAANAYNNGGVTYWKVTRTQVTQGTTTIVPEDPNDPNNTNVIATRGTATWGTGWITTGTISPASFDNTPTANTTYVDITNSTEAPILDTTDGYLYINKGYTDNLKIHIGKFISPDVTISRSDQILLGYTAYDSNGNLLTGTIPSKNGSNVSQSGDTITIPYGKYETTVGQHDAVTYTIPSGDYSASGTTNNTGTVTTSASLLDAVATTTYGFTSTAPSSGTSGTNFLTISSSGTVGTNWSVTSTATITQAGYIATGSKTATTTGAPLISGGTSYYVPIVTPTFSGGAVTGSSTTSITTSMDTSTTATSYYIDASSTGSATRAAVTYSNDAGVIAAHSGATASAAPSSATSITSSASRVYVPAAVGAINMAAGNGSCAYSSANSSNITVSDTDTSGVSIGFTGSGAVSATCAITTAGYAPLTNSFATGTSTSSNSATATKYVTGVKLVAPSSGTRYFDIQVPNGSTTEWITFRFTVDSSGNVTVAGPD